MFVAIISMGSMLAGGDFVASLNPNQVPYAKYQQEVVSLFENAVSEAQDKAPASPAVNLGQVVVQKLSSNTCIPRAITIRAARLLLPLCTTQAHLLREFIQTSGV
jgi:hypothetical protein